MTSVREQAPSSVLADRWMRLSHTPLILSRSHRSGWRYAEFQEIKVPMRGTFSGASEAVHVTATCGPMSLRYGGHRNRFQTRPPFVHMKLPGDFADGAWQGRQRGLHLFLDPHLIEAHTHRAFKRESYQVQPLHEPAAMSLMQALSCDVGNGHRSGPTLGENIIGAIICLFESGSGELRKLPPNEQLERVFDLIEAEIDRPLSLVRLAQEVDLSVRHLSRVFRKVTGNSPHEYIVRRRVERARELIESSVLDLAEIADLVGFSSQAHLSSSMKQVLGVTPSQFRKCKSGWKLARVTRF